LQSRYVNDFIPPSGDHSRALVSERTLKCRCGHAGISRSTKLLADLPPRGAPGGLPQSKRTDPLMTLHEKEIDVFSVMKTNLTPETLKYYPFNGYSLNVLPIFRHVASGILMGVKKELTADFRIIKAMGTDCDKIEVVHLDVWKS
ncbi:hypothetical protein NPIL_373461, partial [Nephila pilipes]